ncbi:MAG TPA: PEP-CTERM sorting domain-containing protein [Rhizomicrobium sp.]|nr:PEP-CTERM sorting domain-containing protein [Rhizomicrobium sp.]
MLERKNRTIWGFAACAAFVCTLAVPATAFPITSALDPALTGATLQDFESATPGNFVTQTYGGLTVTAINSLYANPASFSIANDYAGQYNTRGLQHISNFGDEFQELRFDFANPTSAFGFLFGASDSTWILDAYNSSNTLLDTFSIPATHASNAGDFFGLGGLGGASYATLTQVQDGAYAGGGVDYVFVDNFTYEGGKIERRVPEPLTVSIFGAGLAGALVLRRRRKA